MSINNLQDLIEPYLEKYGRRFVSSKVDYFLALGENYGSVMLMVDIKVKNSDDNKEETIHCVAKMLPPSQTLRDYFNTSVTFKKEVNHYKTVVPILNKFGKEMGVDNLMSFCAECLGARISLSPQSDIVDDDAVLVLENLKVQGYGVADRFGGFDLVTSKLILKNLARMHAAIIAFKLKKPEEFKTKILPNLVEGMVFVATPKLSDSLVENIQKYASRNPQCVPLADRIAKGIRKIKDIFVYNKIREPFATIVHTDLWTNNMLIKYEDGKATSNIFIDFPLCQYSSPARDVLFFIYSSANLDVIRTKADELFKFYYDSLIEVLTKLKCDTTPFTYELFLEEIDVSARDTEFCHCMFMCTPIYTAKGEIKDLSEWKPEDISPEKEESLHPNYHEKLQTTILEFAKRNWI